MPKINTFAKLWEAAQGGQPYKLAVAEAQDQAVLEAVVEASKLKLVEAILVGDEAKIKTLLDGLGQDPQAYCLVDSSSPELSAQKTVTLAHEGKADAVLKGLLPTSTLMRAALNKEYGLRSGNTISHAMIYEIPGREGFLVNTDGGMLPFPNLDQKRAILENAASMLQSLGYDNINAAVLAASEQVDPKIEASLDAAQLAQESDHWQKWHMSVFGPVALDLAVSEEAAAHKGYTAQGAGQADIVLVPDFLVGNALGKALTYFAGADSAGLILGAAKPIILVSRADSAKVKLNSLALAAVLVRK